jgi:ribonuclease P protein component
MLPKTLRLSRQDFLIVKRQGKSFKSKIFSLAASPNTLNTSRFAVVTSTKLAKNAVVRNRLRRKIYEALKDTRSDKMDIIIFPRPEALKLSHEEICFELDSLLSKVSGVS